MTQPLRMWWTPSQGPLPVGKVITVALLRRRYQTPYAEPLLVYYGFLRPYSRGSSSRWARCVIERELPKTLDPYFELSVRDALLEIPIWLNQLRLQALESIHRHPLSLREAAQVKYEEFLQQVEACLAQITQVDLRSPADPSVLSERFRLGFPPRLWMEVPTFRSRIEAVIEAAEGVSKYLAVEHPATRNQFGSLLLGACPKGVLKP